MILTVTMNPSIDISYALDKLSLDDVNRVQQVSKTAGGKGLNVTRVLSQLGDSVMATGLIGGKLGEFLTEQLDSQDIPHSFYPISGETRNCIAILHEGNQTEILEQGPSVSQKEADGFLKKFEELLLEAKLVVLSGSLPSGLPSSYYVTMVELCQKHGLPVVVDCSGQALEELLKSESKPTVIKPNLTELSVLFGDELTADPEVLKEATSQKLFDGIDWVIVSLGAQGAFVKNGDKFYRVIIPKISVVNPVGSGDSTVAGIASSLVAKEGSIELLKKANTLGMLNAQESETGYVNLANYDQLVNQIKVMEV